MSKQNRASAPKLTINVTERLKAGKDEMSFQRMIERFQLALYNREITYRKQVKRGLDELSAIKKMESQLKDAKIKPLSHYTYLLNLYLNELSNISYESFKEDVKPDIARAIGKAKSTVTKDQEKVITDYYEFKAKQNMWAIEQIRDFLIIKGQIKPSKTDQERLEKEVGEVVAA